MTRAERFAADYEAAMDSLIGLVESLDDERWRRVGANYPQRMNEEDESRPVGVIAHHVAVSDPRIRDRLLAVAEGRQPPPATNFPEANRRHAAEHADVNRAEVLAELRRLRTATAAALRSLDDAALERSTDTAAGPMTVAQRIERVLIGHVTMHTGSIEAAVSS